MANVLYYILGNSDLVINETISRFQNYRTISENIVQFLSTSNCEHTFLGYNFDGTGKMNLDDNELSLTSVSLPIFTKVWQTCKNNVDHVVLFATDQGKSAANTKDTLYVASIVQKWINDKDENVVVDIIVINKNPSDWDAMALYFKEFRNSNLLMDNAFKNYVFTTTGTPAAITALAMTTADLNVEYLYLPFSKNPKVQRIDAFNAIQRQFLGRQLAELIRQFNYSAALKIAQLSPLRSQTQFLDKLSAAHQRFCFNYKSALETSQCIKDHKFSMEFGRVSDILTGNVAAYLAESLDHINISIELDQLHQALAYSFNFLENCRNYLVKSYLKIEIKGRRKDDGQKYFPEWEKWINENDIIPHDEKVKFYNPSRQSVCRVLSLLNEKNNDPQLAFALKFLIKLEENKYKYNGETLTMQDLRNKGPFAHGFLSVNDSVIKEIWPPLGINSFMQDLIAFYQNITGNFYEPNVFSRLNDNLLQTIEVFVRGGNK